MSDSWYSPAPPEVTERVLVGVGTNSGDGGPSHGAAALIHHRSGNLTGNDLRRQAKRPGKNNKDKCTGKPQ